MDLFDLVPVDRRGQEFASVDRAEPIPFRDPHEECPRCFLPVHRRRTGPFTVVWQPGSDVIPDFLFGYHGEFAVTERVKVAFEAESLKGYVAWPLQMREPPERVKRKRPIVPWPYTGPPFWDLHVIEDVDLVPEKSTVEFRPPCVKCGRRVGEPVGGPSRWRLVVDREFWNNADFMNPRGVNTILVTERVADIIRENKFSNVDFRKVGRIQ